MRPLLQRTIGLEALPPKESQFQIRGEFRDDNHHFQLSIWVDIETAVVTKTEISPVSLPFDICRSVTGLESSITGLKIGSGVTRKLQKRLRTSTGCYHLYELAVNMFWVASNVLIGLRTGYLTGEMEGLAPDEILDRTWGHLRDSCLAYHQKEPRSDRT